MANTARNRARGKDRRRTADRPAVHGSPEEPLQRYPVVAIYGRDRSVKQLVSIAHTCGFDAFDAQYPAKRSLVALNPWVADGVRLTRYVEEWGWKNDEIERLLAGVAKLLGPTTIPPVGPLVVYNVESRDELLLPKEVVFHGVAIETPRSDASFLLSGVANTTLRSFKTWLMREVLG